MNYIIRFVAKITEYRFFIILHANYTIRFVAKITEYRFFIILHANYTLRFVAKITEYRFFIILHANYTIRCVVKITEYRVLIILHACYINWPFVEANYKTCQCNNFDFQGYTRNVILLHIPGLLFVIYDSTWAADIYLSTVWGLNVDGFYISKHKILEIEFLYS